MSFRQVIPSALAAVIVVGVLGMMNILQGQAPAGGTAVAVVDIAEVFENLEERTAIEADIRAQIESMRKWEQEASTEITSLQSDLEIMDRDSDGFKKAYAELEQKTLTFQVQQEVRKRSIDRKRAENLENIYKKMVEGIGEVAASEGYDLVLTKDQATPLRGASQREMLTMIQFRKMLYSNPNMDITQRVKTKLNNDFNNAPKG